MGRPHRTCVGCRRTRPQSELVRIHLDATGRLKINRHGAGMGAWLCRDTVLGCFEVAAKIKGFERALRREVQPASLVKLRHQLEHTMSNTETSPESAHSGPTN